MSGTLINLANQTSEEEFNAKVENALINSDAHDVISDFIEFDIVNGHDHNGVNAKLVTWNNLSGVPDVFAPDVHSHNSHTSIGLSDHHDYLSTGYAIVPASVSVTSYVEAPDGSTIRFGDTTLGVKVEYDDVLSGLVIKDWGSGTSGLYILSSIASTTIESPTINIGSTSSNLYFKTANLNATSWSVTGTGAASFLTVNGVTIGTSGITGVSYFNEVEILSSGTHSKIQVGNATYQISHSTHAQNTDVGTTNSKFRVYQGGNPLIIASDDYSEPTASEAAIYNDINVNEALVIAGNNSSGTGKKIIMHDDVLVSGLITSAGKTVVTYSGPASALITDNSTMQRIRIGGCLIQWGTTSGTGWKTVTFSQVYLSAPAVSASCTDSSASDYRTRNVTITGFDVKAVSGIGDDVSADLSWTAIGNG